MILWVIYVLNYCPSSKGIANEHTWKHKSCRQKFAHQMFKRISSKLRKTTLILWIISLVVVLTFGFLCGSFELINQWTKCVWTPGICFVLKWLKPNYIDTNFDEFLRVDFDVFASVSEPSTHGLWHFAKMNKKHIQKVSWSLYFERPFSKHLCS